MKTWRADFYMVVGIAWIDGCIRGWHVQTFEDGIKFRKKYPEEAQLAMDLEGQIRGCLSGDTCVILPNGKNKRILELYEKKYRGRLKAYDIEETEAIFDSVVDIYYSGRKNTFKICLKDDKTIIATADHFFLTKTGWKKVSDLRIGKDFVAIDITLQKNISWMGWRKVSSIIPNGIIDTYDIAMEGRYHNFVANEIVTHNSGQHAAAICISNESLYNGKRCNLCVRNGKIVANWDKHDAEYVGLMGWQIYDKIKAKNEMEAYRLYNEKRNSQMANL